MQCPRTRQYMADPHYNNALLYLPRSVVVDRLPSGAPAGHLVFQKCHCSWQCFDFVFVSALMGLMRHTSPSLGLADLNPLSAKYKEHIRSFLGKLRDYGIHRGAQYLEDWIDDNLLLLPPLDISSFFG